LAVETETLVIAEKVLYVNDAVSCWCYFQVLLIRLLLTWCMCF